MEVDCDCGRCSAAIVKRIAAVAAAVERPAVAKFGMGVEEYYYEIILFHIKIFRGSLCCHITVKKSSKS